MKTILQGADALHRVLGMMSGTSLDGLDIACCEFTRDESGRWHYTVTHADTFPYDLPWRNRLASLPQGTALEYALADSELGHLMGQLARDFIRLNDIKPELIASHGHTVFHQPHRRLTTQIGKGPAIAAETGIPVIYDFRSYDVALGGQGAPLVPVGDRLLFPDYRYCLNIGGFANISEEVGGRRLAYDLCPANIVLNMLAARKGLEYDPGGRIAKDGTPDMKLLEALENLPYYRLAPPKSLGKEWVAENIHPLLTSSLYDPGTLLSTFTEHIARRITAALSPAAGDQMLVTGGGAFNSHLLSLIRKKTPLTIVVPDPLIVKFKEALIFAFLGLLRARGEINVLSSVTGSPGDTSSGAIY